MSDLQACDHCGTRLDTSPLAAGQVFSCGACGAELIVAARTKGASPAPRQRVPEKSERRSPRTRRRRRVEDASREAVPSEAVDARARIRAGKRCATSVYICIAAIPGWFLGGFIVSAVCGLIAAFVAILGLTGLARVGPGPAPHECPSGVVRLGATMARSGKQKGVTGLAIGLAIVALSGAAFLLFKAEADREQERRDALHADWDDVRARQESEMVARAWLNANVGSHMRRGREAPEFQLPREEIARRLLVFVEEYPDSVAVVFLLEEDQAKRYSAGGGSEVEPWVTWRRILGETRVIDAEAALPGAVEALIEAVGSRDTQAASAAIQALGEIGSPGAARAVPALERVRDGDRAELKNDAVQVLRMLRSP